VVHYRRDEIVGDLRALEEDPGHHRAVQQGVLLGAHLDAGGLEQEVERGDAVGHQLGERLGAVRIGVGLGRDGQHRRPPGRVPQAQAQAGQPLGGDHGRVGPWFGVTAGRAFQDHVGEQA